MKNDYKEAFYDYAERLTLASAEVIVGEVLKVIQLDSLVDFGCGRAVWLKAWTSHGVDDVFGLDGDFVDPERLWVEKRHFRHADLSETVNLNRKFNMAQCLEVAEHLPEASADTIVATLTDHADLVLFSAAPPGQGGFGHVNERPYEYWRQKFGKLGFVVYDPIRPKLRGRNDVLPWYRYNLLLYVRERAASELPESVQAFRIPRTTRIPDVGPFGYRLRKALLSWIPIPIMNRLAMIKQWLALRRFQSAADRTNE